MGDMNLIRTLGDYSKPSHEDHRNTIELPEGSITTWEDLTTRSLAQFFPPRRTAKLRNGILMFSNIKESLFLKHGLNDPRDSAKLVKVISLLQDVPSTSDRRLIEFKNQVQRLMEAHLAPRKLTQVNKITSLSERNKNPSSSKRVHFVISIIILNKGDEAKEKDGEKSTTTNCTGHETTDEIEKEIESEEEAEEETEEETKEETKEEDDGNLKHFDTFPTINELRGNFIVCGDGLGIKPDGVASPASFGTIKIHGSIYFMKE
nr:MAK10-like protein [Tanacetum cinerariifolium]